MTGSLRHSPVPVEQVSVSGRAWSVQVKPPSFMHLSSQPSPFARLPSSHSSPASTLPLPQLVSHARVVAPSRHLGSLVQVFEHPVPSPSNSPLHLSEPGTQSPSSHDSPASTILLPHLAAVHLLGSEVLSQVAPGSTTQVGEQPSSGIVLPSSHPSLPAMIFESPHAGTHLRPGT